MRFRPVDELDLALLAGVPGVTDVRRSGAHVTVTGRGDFATAVTSVLARNRVVVADLRIDQRTLDDAYLALTGGPSARA
jgi:ABC-2 type transport system ATP-binding protein